MSMWRRIGFSGLLMGMIGLAILPGCGGGGGPGNTAGPNPEVEIVPPTDASGKSYPITDEAQTPEEAKAK
jgi:hypothetical protein